MRLRHLRVQNFRGIKSLDWTVASRVVCLIGAGDSGKSTILTAIDFALGERWSLSITDADFFGCDITVPIVIDATVTEVAAELTTQDRFGLWLRGVASDGTIHDDPHEDDDPALTVRLTIDSSLEPSWTLIKEVANIETRFSSASRGRLGVFRVDEASSHLRWVRGSALNHLSGASEVAEVLTQARRKARDAVFDHPLPRLQEAAAKAGEAARAMGSAPFDDPRPGLDPANLGRGAGLVLHDGLVPATQLGAGSQRLAGIAFQLGAFDRESLVLVDEIELGLEPHRLTHLLRQIRSRADSGTGQVMFTTHSPLIVEAVPVDELHIVRTAAAGVSVAAVPAQLEDFKSGEPQATARSGPSALLARRVVICEGKTELGICRRLTKLWDAEDEGRVALVGTAFRLGGGSEAPAKARCLAELGYLTALLTDDDLGKEDKSAFDKNIALAERAGVRILRWGNGLSIEDQIAQSLPDTALQQLVELAVEMSEKMDPAASVRQNVTTQLSPATKLSGVDVASWVAEAALSWETLRVAIGKAAHKSSWFKNEDRGERLGEIVLSHLSKIDSADPLVVTVQKLRSFVLAEDVEEMEAPVGQAPPQL